MPEADAAEFARYVESIDRGARVVVLHDSDADGVTAAVVLQRALERLDFTDVERIIPNRERDAWTDANRAAVASRRPAALFVLDLGVRSEPIVLGVRTCFIDHHRPQGVPPDSVVISAYTWDPIPNTSLIVYDLCAPLTGVQDLDWIAAIGALSDLGERAPFDLLREVKKRYTCSVGLRPTSEGRRGRPHYTRAMRACDVQRRNAPK